MKAHALLFLVLSFSFSANSQETHPSQPHVKLDDATITGISNGSLSKFLGIPFATAPRFDLPRAVSDYIGNINASGFGPSCPQQLTVIPPSLPVLLPAVTSQSEDCLSVNVYVPSGTKFFSKLPVAVYIFGGGFQIGSTESIDDTITRITNRSIALGLPMIQVSMNYRVSAYGFLASREVNQAKVGNIGLYDQRLALQWVQKYIRSFGGDPSKVVIYGSSAGAISANLQMLGFGGNIGNLFRGAFMQSGGPLPVGRIEEGQVYYDALVHKTGCASSLDTLQCLREIPFENLKTAVDSSPNIFDYQSLKIAWLPLVDGIFLREDPYSQIKAGRVPTIPIVSGNSDDEGTEFSFSQSNVTTETDFRNYVKQFWFPTASDAELLPIWTNYTSDPSTGSPFGTGDLNQLYPQFKRLAAFQGDIIFQAPRRFFLKNLPATQKKWAYLSKVFKSTPLVGSFHGTEVASDFLDDPFINFVSNLDPNTASGPAWPQYSAQAPVLMTFNDSGVRFISQDTYRAPAMECLTDLVIAHPM